MRSDSGIDREQLLAKLFDAVVETDRAERAQLLDDCCSGDPDLRRAVDELLRHHEAAMGILDRPLELDGLEDFDWPDWPGRDAGGSEARATEERIGRYEILGILGRGGMGTVYAARQREPVDRVVALKVVDVGRRHAQEITARFDAERQALSLLDSPEVATLLDSGVTSDGTPFFVMECVDGPSITEYCDQQRLSVRDRLLLFVQVCRGVEHAHQKGIIHRDLKPSNILVTTVSGEPRPKIIDFGIAKAIHPELLDREALTNTNALLGTRGYMSPEQTVSGGRDVDTRTDIYSLGVVLYQLMVGVLPFPLSTTEPDATHWNDPVRPHERARGRDEEAMARALSRRSTPAGLARQLEGDLDWIILKALEFDRERRYGTARELRADIERRLRNEPVLARPPELRYRLRKFVRRNRVAVLASLAVGLALISATAVSTTFFLSEQRSRKHADAQATLATHEAEKARAVTTFMKEVLISQAPEINNGKPLTVAEAFTQVSAAAENWFLDRPELHSELRVTLGEIHLAQGRYRDAENQLRAALAAFETQPRTAFALQLLARLKLAETIEKDRGAFAECEEILSGALRRFPPGNEDEAELALMVRLKLAQTSMKLEHLGAAEREYRSLLDEQMRGTGERDPLVATTLVSLGTLLVTNARYAEAESLLLRALAIREELFGRDDTQTAKTAWALAYLWRTTGQYEKSLPYLEAALPTQIAANGPTHPATLRTQQELGAAYAGLGRFDEAEALLTSTQRVEREVLPNENDEVAKTHLFLGDLHFARGRPDAAEESYREALRIFRARPTPSRVYIACLLERVGRIEEHRMTPSEARAHYEEALDLYAEVLRMGHPQTEALELALARLGEDGARAGAQVLGDSAGSTVPSGQALR